MGQDRSRRVKEVKECQEGPRMVEKGQSRRVKKRDMAGQARSNKVKQGQGGSRRVKKG